MAFSFTPGQEQTTPAGQSPQPQAQAPLMKNGIPALVVPTIAVGETVVVEEKISPFAFRNRNKSKFGLYFQSAILVVFGILVLITVGLFVYQGMLQSQITAKKQELEDAQKTFPKLPLDDMQKISDHLKIVNRVMKEHASVRTAFEILARSVQDPVVYTKFELGKDKEKKGYNLSLTAEALNYHSAYLQIEEFKRDMYSRYLAPVKVSDLGLDPKTGIVSFKLSTAISLEGYLPELIRFGSTTQEVASSSPVITPVVNNSKVQQGSSTPSENNNTP